LEISSACTPVRIRARSISLKTRSGSERATHRFLDAERARHRAESTIRAKHRLIVRFRAWLYVEGRASSLASIDEQTARDYRRWLSSHFSPTSWNPILAAPSQFFRWAARESIVLLDPFERVRPSPQTKTLPPYLTQAEVRSILEVCDPETQLRDRAVLEVLYSSALRIGELLRLDLTDIDFGGRTIVVRQGKGKKDRIVPIGRIAARLTRAYVQTRRVAAPCDARALFVDDMGNRMTTWGVANHILAPAIRGAGIQKHVTPHVLRHSCAIHMLERGAGIREVQQLLGHAKISTTQKYLNVIPIELKKAHAASHPGEHRSIPPSVTPIRSHASKWDSLRRPRE
jgi:site-specific recombinase XerD